MFGKSKLKVKEAIQETKEKNLRAEGIAAPDKPVSDRFEVRRYATSYEERVLDNETGEESSVTDFIVDFANYLASKGEK